VIRLVGAVLADMHAEDRAEHLCDHVLMALGGPRRAGCGRCNRRTP
jgi:hypothetical protein